MVPADGAAPAGVEPSEPDVLIAGNGRLDGLRTTAAVSTLLPSALRADARLGRLPAAEAAARAESDQVAENYREYPMG